MKSFKSLLAIVALFAVSSMDAKRTTGAAARPAGETPAVTPTRPALGEPSARNIERQLASQIDQMTSIIEMNNNATQNFINIMQQSNLSSSAKQDYLQAAIQIQDMISQNGSTNKNKITNAKGFGLISTVRPGQPKKGLFKGLSVEEPVLGNEPL